MTFVDNGFGAVIMLGNGNDPDELYSKMHRIKFIGNSPASDCPTTDACLCKDKYALLAAYFT